jgi:CheY-like chemotaxis protein
MHPAKILVIEDNESEIGPLRHALDQSGEPYELEILNDGRGPRFVHEHRAGIREPKPCVILLDLYLPRYDGVAVPHPPGARTGAYSHRGINGTGNP